MPTLKLKTETVSNLPFAPSGQALYWDTDLKGFGARSQEVPVQVEVLNVSGVRVIDVSPRTITVNLENEVTNKVPITTRAVGQLPIGYELGQMSPVINSVTVRGPESLVALVSEDTGESWLETWRLSGAG